MSKASLADKMRIETLSEQRLGAKAIMAAACICGQRAGWALSTVKKICQHVDRMGSATQRKAGYVVGRNLHALKQTLLLSFFNAETSVGGHVKKSMTSSFFNRIVFHLAVRCRTFQKINL